MTPTPDIVCIINPTSGGGRAGSLSAGLRAAFTARGHEPAIRYTERPGHAIDLACSAAEAGARRIVTMGGDGTIHETANGLLRALDSDASLSAVLGLVPVGTGNDFVKVAGGRRDLDTAVETVVNGVVHRFDVGKVSWSGGGEFFVNAAGTGIDVEVVRVLDRDDGGGAMVYVRALARALRRYQPIPVRLDVDGRKSEGRIMMIAIANGQSVGGAFRICPDAIPDDGLFDVCTVRELPLVASIVTAARIVRGSHCGLKSVTMQRGRRIELAVPDDTPLYFQLDGELREPAGAHALTIEVLPGALPVMIPAAA